MRIILAALFGSGEGSIAAAVIVSLHTLQAPPEALAHNFLAQSSARGDIRCAEPHDRNLFTDMRDIGRDINQLVTEQVLPRYLSHRKAQASGFGRKCQRMLDGVDARKQLWIP